MDYQQISIPPEEAQFLETRKFQIDEIARLYRVPPHMIGDLEKSSFNNIEQQSLGADCQQACRHCAGEEGQGSR